MRVLRLMGIVLALSSWVLMLPTAPVQASAPEVRQTTVTANWPAAPLPMNEDWDLTVQVSPAQAGRVVRLDVYGQGGPGWSRLDSARTDSAGRATVTPFTYCSDDMCTRFTYKYRIVVPASGGATAAQTTGRVTVVR